MYCSYINVFSVSPKLIIDDIQWGFHSLRVTYLFSQHGEFRSELEIELQSICTFCYRKIEGITALWFTLYNSIV